MLTDRPCVESVRQQQLCHTTKAFITTATLLRCWALRTHKPGSVSLLLTDADGREIHWSTKLSFSYHCFIDSKVWNNFHATSNRPDFFGKNNLKYYTKQRAKFSYIILESKAGFYPLYTLHVIWYCLKRILNNRVLNFLHRSQQLDFSPCQKVAKLGHQSL